MGKEFRRDINYYKILQVDPEADPLVIKNAYYTILNRLKCHPDKGGDLEQAKLINEAYHILSSAQLREDYDRFLQALAEEKHDRSFGEPQTFRVMDQQRYPRDPRSPRAGNRSFLDDWLKDFFGLEEDYGHQGGDESWSPPANIYRNGDNIVIKLEVPGVRWEDIHIQFVGGILTIFGEKKEENQRWIRVEFQYGGFHRSFQLPGQVLPEKINASLKDGILEMTIPLGEKKKTRTIPITQL